MREIMVDVPKGLNGPTDNHFLRYDFSLMRGFLYETYCSAAKTVNGLYSNLDQMGIMHDLEMNCK